MEKNEQEANSESACNLTYLTELMGGKRELIIEIMNVFLHEIPLSLASLNAAIAIADFESLKILAHTMKSSVSIMGISSLHPLLQEMESIGKKADLSDIDRIGELNLELIRICTKAIAEIENDKANLY